MAEERRTGACSGAPADALKRVKIDRTACLEMAGEVAREGYTAGFDYYQAYLKLAQMA